MTLDLLYVWVMVFIRAGGLLAVAILPTLAGLHGDAYRNVSTMVHGYRIVAMSCLGLFAASAVIIALTVRNDPRVLTNATTSEEG